MKTSHQLARELLAGPDLPIWHFDPSCAGYDDENDTAMSCPVVEYNGPEDYIDPDTGETKTCSPMLTIIGNQHEENQLPSDA